MSLRIGHPAPAFTVDAYLRGHAQPHPVSLGDHRGRWVVLFFYPRDFTFICPTELQALGALHAEFGREGAAVLAASTDSFFNHGRIR